MLKTYASAISAAALTVCLGTPAAASPMDHLTKFTFNQPIAIPGVTLPAGTYIFKLADPSTNRKIVQVLDAKSMRSYALLQAMPKYRPDNAGAAALTLMDTADGMPAAVETWWPLGENVGFEFLYPEDQHAKLTGNWFGPSTIEGDGLPAIEASIVAAAPALEASAQSAPVTQGSAGQAFPEAAAVDQNQANRDALPQTATPAALVALFGALTLFGGGFALGKARR